jgi:DNA-binding response OmpR family regulator
LFKTVKGWKTELGIILMEAQKKILIADDDQTFLFAFNALFRHLDISIDTSDSVEHAKELISKNDYELVITDLQFTENEPEGGREIIHYLRQKSPSTRIILLTAFDTEDGKLNGNSTKPDYYLQKPVKSDAIKEIMHNNGIL